MDAAEPRRAPQGTALLLALLAACAYAAFAQGATRFPQETRLQVALAVAALLVAIAIAGGRGLHARASRPGWVAVALLVAFAAWSGLSLLWSVAPDRTWIEVNRAIAYALVLGLGIVVGASAPRALERFAVGWLCVSVAVALYAFGGKALPGVNVPGIFDLNHTRSVARLRAPLEYWNALALVCALGVPVAVRLAADRLAARRVRAGALLAAFLLVVVVGMTYSRGGLLALFVGAGVLAALGGAGGRSLGVLAAALTASVPVLGVAFGRTALTSNGAPLDERIADGRVLLVVFVLCAAVLVGAALAAMRVRLPWRPEWGLAVRRGTAVAGAALVLAGVIGMAFSEDGVRGSASELVSSFTDGGGDDRFDPDRLTSTNSGNRWAWWTEAAGAWSDRPLGGWGAGSFPVTHLVYRDDRTPVAQPHSVPLQFLAETGLVGLLLAFGSIGLLLWAGIARVRRLPAGSLERGMAAALLAGAFGWLAHGFYDWDWDIPGVTVPVMAALGVLAAAPGRSARRRPLFADPERGATVRGSTVLAAAVAAVICAGVVASAVLPAVADSKASAAQASVDREDASEEVLEDAAADAALAAKLDPVSVDPLFAQSAIAQRRGRDLEARDLLLEAVDRQPESVEAWAKLASVAFLLADRQGFDRAARRALALDPNNPSLASLASRAQQFLAPVGSSATATATPLAPAP